MDTKFRPGDKVTHTRWGRGVVRKVYAIATPGTSEETEYVVKLRSDRYPVTLTEVNLERA